MSVADLPETTPSPPEPAAPPVPRPFAAPADPARPRWPTEATITAWLLIAVGVALRLRRWWYWRSFWLDELYLAHSVLTRGFHRLLFTQLDYWQGAPAGFLALARFFADCFGHDERALRTPSMLAGVAALPMFYLLARRLLSVRATLLALLLFVSLRPLIYYSGELKQYSSDVAVSVAILLAAVAAWQKPSWKTWLILGMVGALGIFFAYPGILVVAAVAGAILIARPRQSLVPILLCGVIWGGLEWLNIRVFLASLMHGEAHDGLMRYWEDNGGFPPRQPNFAMAWIYTSFRDVFAGYGTMYIISAPLAMFAAMIGLAALLRRRWPAGLLLLAPLCAAIAAAFAKRYPFADRLTMYIVPILVLLLAEGLDQIWGRAELGEGGWTRSVVGLLAGVMIIAEPVHRAIHEFHFPPGREETKQVYQWLRHNWQPGDVLYLSLMADRSYDEYAPQVGLAGLQQLWPLPGDARQQLESSAQGMRDDPGFSQAVMHSPSPDPPASGYVVWQPDCSQEPSGYLDHIDATFHPDPSRHFPPVHRVWVFFTHTWDPSGLKLEPLMRAELGRCAKQSYGHSEEGASVVLYELK